MRHHRIVTTLVAAAALVAGLALAPSSALAGHKHHAGCGHHPAGHSNGHDGWYDDDEWYDGDDEWYDDYGPRRFSRAAVVVPDRIVYAEVGHYRPYYKQRVYHRAHRHYHPVYAFPIHTSHGLAYREVPYCGGPRGYVAFAGPRLAFQVRF
jgi:hypothetical protein